MENVSEVTPKKSGSVFKLIVVTFFIAVSAVGYVAAYYFYNQYKQTKIVLDNPDVASQNEVKNITDKLGKIYDLPQDEEPTVATVLDKEKLSDQPFFNKAENGDKIIIYTKNQIAILFRIEANKIINIAPVSLQEQPTQDQSNAIKTSQPKPTESSLPQ